MNPDTMLVEAHHITQALDEVTAQGARAQLQQLCREEPILGSFLNDRLTALAGRMALRGVSSLLVRRTHAEVLHLVLSSLAALQKGQRALWNEPPEAAAPSQVCDNDIPF